MISPMVRGKKNSGIEKIRTALESESPIPKVKYDPKAHKFPLFDNFTYFGKTRDELLYKDENYYAVLCRNLLIFWNFEQSADKGKETETAHQWIPRIHRPSKAFVDKVFAEFAKGAMDWENIMLIADGKFEKKTTHLDSIDRCERDYWWKKELGEGGFGTVFKIQEKETGFIYAGKKIDLKGKGRRTLKTIFSETETMNHVNHAMITNYHVTFEENKILHIVLPLYTGGDLRHKLTVHKRAKKLNEKYSKKIIFQLISALNFLHHKHITHADIKPENIMFVRSNSLKIVLIDLGMCMRTGMGTKTRDYWQKVAGTPYYIAPETWARKKSTEYVDIWATGIMVFEMVFGYLPFNGDSMIQLRSNVSKGLRNFPSGRHCSTEVTSFIKSCLNMNPAERPSALELQSHPWIEYTETFGKVEPEMINALLVEKLTEFQKVFVKSKWKETVEIVNPMYKRFCERYKIDSTHALKEETYKKCILENSMGDVHESEIHERWVHSSTNGELNASSVLENLIYHHWSNSAIRVDEMMGITDGDTYADLTEDIFDSVLLKAGIESKDWKKEIQFPMTREEFYEKFVIE